MTGMRSGALATLAICAAALAAQAQPASELWRYEGQGGPATVKISVQDGRRVLSFEPDGGAALPLAREERYQNVFDFPGSPGLAGFLEGLTARRESLVLAPDGDGFVAEFRRGNRPYARGRMQRLSLRAALIVPALSYNQQDGKAFGVYGRRVGDYYRQQGYGRADVAPVGSVQQLVALLNAAADEGRPYRRVVIIGHGGWDGPMFHGQQASSSENPQLFEQLVAAIQRGTTPDAQLFSSSCHAGGSNRYETDSRTYRWTDDLARRSGRVVAGPNGKTSTEYTYQHVLAVLEGVGVTKQEVRWSSPQGVRTISPGGTVAGSQLQPMPPEEAPPVSPNLPLDIRPTTVNASARRVVDLPLGGGPEVRPEDRAEPYGVPAPLPPVRR